MYFKIFKYVDLKQTIFATNFDPRSSSKSFNTFNFVFLFIVTLTQINKFIYFNIYIYIYIYIYISRLIILFNGNKI